MSKVPRLTGMLLASVVSAVLAIAVAAPAGAAVTGAADPAVAAALERIGTNTSTAADIALVKRDPELARVVVDPSRTTVTTTGNAGFVQRPAGQPGKAQVAGPVLNGCGPVGVTITVKTLLGFDLFKWTHMVGACFDGYNVTSVYERYDYLNYADPTIYVRELQSSVTPLGYEVRSFMQRHLEQCVIRYGCYANWYPYSTVILWGDGYWNYTWGVG
jgi:hypothetical protein